MLPALQKIFTNGSGGAWTLGLAAVPGTWAWPMGLAREPGPGPAS